MNNNNSKVAMVSFSWAWAPGALLLQAAWVGWASAAACGRGSDGVLLLSTGAVLALGGLAARWSLPGVAQEQRHIGRFLWGVALLGVTLEAVVQRRALMLLAHAGLAVSVGAQVSPIEAAWGLWSLPLLLWQPSERMAWVVAVHGALLTLALWRMGWH